MEIRHYEMLLREFGGAQTRMTVAAQTRRDAFAAAIKASRDADNLHYVELLSDNGRKVDPSMACGGVPYVKPDREPAPLYQGNEDRVRPYELSVEVFGDTAASWATCKEQAWTPRTTARRRKRNPRHSPRCASCRPGWMPRRTFARTVNRTSGRRSGGRPCLHPSSGTMGRSTARRAGGAVTFFELESREPDIQAVTVMSTTYAPRRGRMTLRRQQVPAHETEEGSERSEVRRSDRRRRGD